MIHLRHFLHPIRSAQSLCHRLRVRIRRRLAKRQFRDIRRGQRDHCWCGGELLPFKWHPSYGVCVECGCYVDRQPPLPDELPRLYSLDLYWHVRARFKGHPTIECRPENDLSDGRMDYWLGLIERYSQPGDRVVEIGCGSGVLLAELQAHGYKCVGVEADERTAEWVRRNMKVDVRSGFYPSVSLPMCDLFLAFDVIEHSLAPESFMRSAAQLLCPGGVAIIQTPIDKHDLQPPFEGMFDAVFDDLEHLYIFSEESIQRLSKIVNLQVVAEERWHLAHEIVVLRKEPSAR